MWTHFMDMGSGGGRKLKWAHIYIEAPENEAKIIFQNRFDRNPERVTCTCCGRDYSISEEETLEQITAFQRGCAYVYFDVKGNEVTEEDAWKRGAGIKNGYKGMYVERGGARFSFNKEYIPLDQYTHSNTFGRREPILIIGQLEIKPSERIGELREEGFVWKE